MIILFFLSFIVFYYRKRYYKRCTVAILAFNRNLSLMHVHHLFHIGQTKAESLDIMPVSGVDPVKLIEYLFQIIPFYSDTGIPNRQVKAVGIVPCL